MSSVESIIWNKLGINKGDTLPLAGGNDICTWNYNATRTTLAEIMAEAGYKIGAEVGVERGAYSLVLLKTIPNLKLLCIDPWTPWGLNGARKMRRVYQTAVANLAGLNVEFISKTSLEAAEDIPDGSLDFVYIDALHEFDNVMTDIITWVPKVRREGIVSGHDYVPYYQFGVIQAVNVYTRVHNIMNWYIVMGEREPSWFWVNI